MNIKIFCRCSFLRGRAKDLSALLYKPVHHVTLRNTVGNWMQHNGKYNNTIISWDHRRIWGPSLTETSLCGAYPYMTLPWRGISLQACSLQQARMEHQHLKRNVFVDIYTHFVVWNLYEWLWADRSRWPRGLRRGSVVTRLLGVRVRIPPATFMSASCERCVLSGRGSCDGPIPCPEESFRVFVIVIRCNSNTLHLQCVGRERSG